MIFDYIKFKKFPITSDISLFLIHGNPRNISNEIEHDIITFQKKLGFSYTNYVIDDDSQTQEIINNFNEQSLFDEKKVFILNIVSKTIPAALKAFLASSASNSTDNKIIIKLDRQSASFKRTNFYKFLSTSECIIEIYEIKDRVLEQWVENKCKINNIKLSRLLVSNIIGSNMNNSLAISQDIFLRSLLEDSDAINVPQNSKYTEYDLIDMFLNKNNSGFITVSNYLRRIDISLSYLIFILNSELEKLYSLNKPNKSKPYIPAFLQAKYEKACKNYPADVLLFGLKNIADLDMSSKYNAKRSSPWTSFNSLFSSIMS